MASQEHLAMLHDDASSSTTSDEEGEETSSENGEITPSRIPESGPTIEVVAADDDIMPIISPTGPAKKRIKLSLGRIKIAPQAPSTSSNGNATADTETPVIKSLEPPPPKPVMSSTDMSSVSVPKRSLPPKKKALLARAFTDGTDDGDDGDDVKAVVVVVDATDDGDVVKAMVVDSDDAGEDDAVAAVVEEPTPAKTESTPAKRKPANPVRPVRLPPMSSPGLLIPPSSGVLRGTVDANGLTTPASVFDHTMALAGYTTEGRTKRPHRGSSVQRVVGDMFDSNVKFSLHFPKTIPQGLLSSPKREPGESETNGDHHDSLPERLIKALQRDQSNSKTASEETKTTNGATSGKRHRLLRFKDMVPLSLSIPYPEQYIQKRLEYVEKVNEREKSIVAYQESEEALEIEHERNESIGKVKSENEPPPKPSIVIPPIPEPPSPPRLDEMDGFDPDKFDDQYPLYLPKATPPFAAHLDKDCFHVVNGRYFGLLSNFIADPHFVGPNAPGIGGLTLSGGTGLATSHAGGGGSSGMSALLSTAPSQSGVSVNAVASQGKSAATPAAKSTNKKAGTPTASTVSVSGDIIPPTGGKKKSKGPRPTASASDLRKIMEEGGEFAEKMKTCIMRAAVHASRSGKHGQSFRAPNGQTYPDVSKAFAAHAGLKPCIRCKNNKQGAYHCRLRRKHKELDYDGSNSPEVLAPLTKVPMEELVLKPEKKK